MGASGRGRGGCQGAREGVGKRWEGVWKGFSGITASRAK